MSLAAHQLICWLAEVRILNFEYHIIFIMFFFQFLKTRLNWEKESFIGQSFPVWPINFFFSVKSKHRKVITNITKYSKLQLQHISKSKDERPSSKDINLQLINWSKTLQSSSCSTVASSVLLLFPIFEPHWFTVMSFYGEMRRT